MPTSHHGMKSRGRVHNQMTHQPVSLSPVSADKGLLVENHHCGEAMIFDTRNAAVD